MNTHSNYDSWLESPYQDSLRNGEALEALEELYLSSEEHQSAFETWQRDCLSEHQPVTGSVLDLYLSTSDYEKSLDEWVERWLAHREEQDEGDFYDQRWLASDEFRTVYTKWASVWWRRILRRPTDEGSFALTNEYKTAYEQWIRVEFGLVPSYEMNGGKR